MKLCLSLDVYSLESGKEVRDMTLHSGGASRSSGFLLRFRFLGLEELLWRNSSAFSMTSGSFWTSGIPVVKIKPCGAVVSISYLGSARLSNLLLLLLRREACSYH